MEDVIDEFLEAVRRGSARDRYGRSFTRAAARELDWCLRGYVSEELGGMELTDVRRRDVEALIYGLGDAGISRRRLRAVAKSVRALYDYAAERDLVRHNPAERVALPDEDEAEQPTTRAQRRSRRQPLDAADRAIALGLRAATVAFALIALVLFAESL